MSEAETGRPEAEGAGVPTWPRLRQILGPGLVTGAADDDPSGIATYSQAGAQFSYGIGWTMLIGYPLMCAIQQISAEIGRVTGLGLAGNLRRFMPRGTLGVIVALLLLANTINIGADLGAMAASLRLLVPVPMPVGIAGFAIVSVLLEIYVRYVRYVAVLKWLTLSLFAYVATVFVVHVPWGRVAGQVLLPHIQFNSGYFTVVVAVFGTTISPYLFFWQAAEEVEDEREDPDAKPLLEAPEQARRELRRIRLDTYIGMAFSNLISLAIIFTTAATLNVHGITNIQTSAQAADALRPLAGEFAFTLFALGIIGTGLLALPVLAGSAAYALGEAFGWPVGLAYRAERAKAFYGTITVAVLVGALLNFFGLPPVKALFWSAVINGLVAVPLMAVMVLLAGSPRIMGQFCIGPWQKLFGWAGTAVMLFAGIGMFATL
ncbi:NRAMP family divalent metal transporter [Acidocella sp. KAb 2-4]|uniref:NRAMP family divalent metal transporter n=1 Tax=Acidocella sp. KAb 2-4 TaxID=2885158 RepID=UPI001D0954AE|nr:divalent metal cation transporter [Acidocella sp. KAb 2-4]MCB5943333.1 divalent metal cation transporter [Acidocella sp. KAb 2-4]